MAELNIFQKGDKVKFIITSQNKNLDMEACDFYVEIVCGTCAATPDPPAGGRKSPR